MKIVLMGGPGCGKGTQAPTLKERYHLCHLSTGDLLREAIAKKTPSGLQAKSAIDRGQLVADDIVMDVLKEGMEKPDCKNGYILTGFPRTLNQAEKLDAMGEKITKVYGFTVPDEVLIARTSGRWIHKASGRIYHEKFAPPKVKGVDDVTGEPLIQREDDKPQVVKKRLEVYHKEMLPVEEFYNRKNLLSFKNGELPVDVIRAELIRVLDYYNHYKESVTATPAPKKPWWKVW